jgi:hypothetical protein
LEFFFLLNWPIEVERSECKKYIHGSEFKRPDLIEAWNLNGPEAHDTFPMSVLAATTYIYGLQAIEGKKALPMPPATNH